MLAAIEKYFTPGLYALLGTLLLVNLETLLTGKLLAIIPAAFQVVVIGAVYLARPWAYVVVKVWALFVMASGVFMWLAVFIDGVAWFHSFQHAVFYTAMLIIGLYIFKNAKTALNPDVASV